MKEDLLVKHARQAFSSAPAAETLGKSSVGTKHICYKRSPCEWDGQVNCGNSQLWERCGQAPKAIKVPQPW